MDEATLRGAIKKFYQTMEKYSDLGLCDSEGRAAMAEWLDKASRNEPTKPITYRYLQCFNTLFDGDTPIKVEDGVKRQVEAEITAAAEELLPTLCKAKRAGLIGDAYDMIRWS